MKKKVNKEFPQRVFVAIDADEGYLLAGRIAEEVSGAAADASKGFTVAEYELVGTKRVKIGLMPV